jgi:hypothetical protein
VSIWDQDTYDNVLADKPVPQTVTEGIDAGHLEFTLHGQMLQGQFALIRMRKRGRGKADWLLIKMHDALLGHEKPIGQRAARRRHALQAAIRVKVESSGSKLLWSFTSSTACQTN